MTSLCNCPTLVHWDTELVAVPSCSFACVPARLNKRCRRVLGSGFFFHVPAGNGNVACTSVRARVCVCVRVRVTPVCHVFVSVERQNLLHLHLRALPRLQQRYVTPTPRRARTGAKRRSLSRSVPILGNTQYAPIFDPFFTRTVKSETGPLMVHTRYFTHPGGP